MKCAIQGSLHSLHLREATAAVAALSALAAADAGCAATCAQALATLSCCPGVPAEALQQAWPQVLAAARTGPALAAATAAFVAHCRVDPSAAFVQCVPQELLQAQPAHAAAGDEAPFVRLLQAAQCNIATHNDNDSMMRVPQHPAALYQALQEQDCNLPVSSEHTVGHEAKAALSACVASACTCDLPVLTIASAEEDARCAEQEPHTAMCSTLTVCDAWRASGCYKELSSMSSRLAALAAQNAHEWPDYSIHMRSAHAALLALL